MPILTHFWIIAYSGNITNYFNSILALIFKLHPGSLFATARERKRSSLANDFRSKAATSLNFPLNSVASYSSGWPYFCVTGAVWMWTWVLQSTGVIDGVATYEDLLQYNFSGEEKEWCCRQVVLNVLSIEHCEELWKIDVSNLRLFINSDTVTMTDECTTIAAYYDQSTPDQKREMLEWSLQEIKGAGYTHVLRRTGNFHPERWLRFS